MNKFKFFWRGHFSNFYPCRLVIRGATFNCCEQYYMTAKAFTFGDKETANKIMLASHPAEQKRLGRTVKNFDETVWNAVSRDVMFRANYAKYTQHPSLNSFLLDTYPYELVEASPYDSIWGIGLAEDDPRAKDKNTWQGLNWLGEVLTEIRDGLIEQQLKTKRELSLENTNA